MTDELLLYIPRDVPFLIFTVEAEHFDPATRDRFTHVLTRFQQRDIAVRRWKQIPCRFKGRHVFVVELDPNMLDDDTEVALVQVAFQSFLSSKVRKRSDDEPEIGVSPIWACFPAGIRRELQRRRMAT